MYLEVTKAALDALAFTNRLPTITTSIIPLTSTFSNVVDHTINGGTVDG